MSFSANCTFRLALAVLCAVAGSVPASATGLYTLTAAEQDYAFLSANFTLNQPPSVSGNVGLFTGGLFTLSKNTLNGEVDFQGTQNDNESGAFSVTGGEFSNMGLVGTAQSDAQTLAASIAGLSATSIADITSSQAFGSGVYDVQNINLGLNGILTLNAASASDQFVFRISQGFTLGANAQIVFQGPVNPDNVLFYYTGSNGITFGGGPDTGSVFQGILLDNASSAQEFDFNSHSGVGASNGRVFNLSGGGIVFDSGAWGDDGGGTVASVAPEPATWMLAAGGFALLALGRRRKA